MYFSRFSFLCFPILFPSLPKCHPEFSSRTLTSPGQAPLPAVHLHSFPQVLAAKLLTPAANRKVSPITSPHINCLHDPAVSFGWSVHLEIDLTFDQQKKKNFTSPKTQVSASTPSSHGETVPTTHLTHLPGTEREVPKVNFSLRKQLL